LFSGNADQLGARIEERKSAPIRTSRLAPSSSSPFVAYIAAAMKKRLFLLSLSACFALCAPAALAGYVEIARVPMPELTSSQWARLHQQQGSNPQILPVDVNLAVDHGVVYSVSIRHGSGYPDIDNAIVNWIASNWRTDSWFKGGDAYVVSLDVDPLVRHIVFRGNDGVARARYPLLEPLRADVAPVQGY
jgi:hypothetical protein